MRHDNQGLDNQGLGAVLFIVLLCPISKSGRNMRLIACPSDSSRAPRPNGAATSQEGNLPKVLQIDTSRKNALLTVATVSALAMAPWFLTSESAPAAPAPGAIVVAQNPPPCGQDAQHPCPKGTPQQPAPKAAPPPPPPP